MSSPAIIVGAGPAGLAVGASLRRVGVPFIVLEQGDQVAPAWHRHYDRLHLHTHKVLSALPFFPFPRHYPRYPPRWQVVEYLNAYARAFQIEPQFGQRVIAARHDGEGWEVETQTARLRTPQLIVTTGYNREPVVPQWPGQSTFSGVIRHSSQYRNGQAFHQKRVLVVGFGNSGGEIAIDLWEHGAHPSLAVRGPVNVIPRDLLGIPILAIALLQRRLPPRLADALNAPIVRLTIGDLTRYGLRQLPYGPITQIQSKGRIPLIDVGTLSLIQHGRISVHPGLQRFTENDVTFVDGTSAAFDVVILATGYRPRVDAFLEANSGVYDASGTPLVSGSEAPIPGLYFCGFYVAPTGMLREIGLEARRISLSIARHRH